MRKSALLPLFLLAGCSSAPFASDPVSSATLSFREDPHAMAHFAGGIQSIDGSKLPAGHGPILIRPGEHTVAYSCPNTIGVDGPPTLSARFLPGGHYELVCTGAQAEIVPTP
ncbi:MAG: hypothetical protein ABI588_08240 [Arenimonas sp.]